VSNQKPHGATTVRASKGGGAGGKLLLGAVAAAVLLGGGYYVYSNMMPSEPRSDFAYTDTYADDDPLRAAPLDADDPIADTAASDVAPAAAAPAIPAQRTTPARRATAASAADVPEQTIGITPASFTTDDDDAVVVTAPRRPIWASTPSQRRLSALYPAGQLERGREGQARLSCTVQSGGALDCVRIEETPGFGAAAVRVARSFRHAPTLADGADATGTPVNLRVVFRIDDEQPRRTTRLRG